LAQTTAGLTTATVAWSAGTGTNFEIEYGVAGFVQGSGSVVNATASPYQITGLTSASLYDVYIREICAPGDTSAWSTAAQVSTTLCAASSQCMFYFDLTDSFGDGWNGAEISIRQNGVEVAKFGSSFTTGTLFQDSVLLCNGLSTDIILDPQGGWPSEIGVIVYDNQGLPVDSFTTASPAPITGDTLVNFTANCGLPCPDPTGLMATANVGCDSIEVDWMSTSGGSIIEYGVSGFAPGTGTMTAVVTAPYSLTGLNAATAYDVYVADTCTGDTSNYLMLTTSTANAPVPVAAASFTDTVINGAYTLYVDGNGSTNATAYSWDFGNGVTGSGAMDTVVFLGNGVYNVVLTATNACGTSTDTITVNVNIGLIDNPLANSLSVYPNPAQYSVNVSFQEVGSADVQIILRDAQGRSVINMNDRMQSGTYSNDIDVSSLARGIYMLEIKSGSLTAHRRISIK
jgi:PKD repeat protein